MHGSIRYVSIHPVNSLCQHTLPVHPVSILCQHTLLHIYFPHHFVYAWFDQNVGGTQKLSSAELASNHPITHLITSHITHPITHTFLSFLIVSWCLLFLIDQNVGGTQKLSSAELASNQALADEDRWGLYYGVKAMAKDDAEAQVGSC